MKTQTSNALAYTCHYLSFLLKKREAAVKIKAIYLFGSAVRGTLEKGSDIDLFIDCPVADEDQMKKWAHSALIQFTASRDYNKWKLLRFTYPLSIQVGKLQEWDLKLSIASEGILIYAPGRTRPEGKRVTLFTISYPTSKKSYVRLFRLLFGRKEKEYMYPGIVAQWGGKQVAAAVFFVPQHEQVRMAEVLSKEKVHFSMTEMAVLEG